METKKLRQKAMAFYDPMCNQCRPLEAVERFVGDEVATLVDAGLIRSTATEVAGKIDAVSLRTVRSQIESGSARGKIMTHQLPHTNPGDNDGTQRTTAANVLAEQMGFFGPACLVSQLHT